MNASTVTPCIWCKSTSRDYKATRADGTPIYQCQDCGHRAVANIAALDLEAIYAASSYYEKLETVPVGSWSAELFSALLLLEDKAEKSVLDIGCATGIFLDMCQNLGCTKTWGIDTSERAQQVCLEKGHKIACDSTEKLTDTSAVNPALVTGFHVVEHFTDPYPPFAVIEKLIKQGSRLLAVFPNVDFSSPNWSGYNDSFSHISFFYPQFVEKYFPQLVNTTFEMLSSPGLVYCFAGDLSKNSKSAIHLARYFSENPQAEIDESKQKAISELSIIGLAFLIVFLSRNHSAALAASLLKASKNNRQWLDNPGWYDLCEAFVFYQNGNVYGCASALDKISPASKDLNYIKNLLVADLPQVLKQTLTPSTARNYPVISISTFCNANKPIKKEFFESVARQTYPYVELTHITQGATCHCAIPDIFKPLVRTINIEQANSASSFEAIYQAGVSDIILWTDGSLVLSEYCLFALYYELINNGVTFVYPKTAPSKDYQEMHFPFKRSLEKLAAKVFGQQYPPLVMFKKTDSKLICLPPSMIGNQGEFTNQLRQFSAQACKDVLAWTNRS